MRILTKEEFELEKETIMEEIWNGSVIIHPTDTIYGLGCNALLFEAVKKIREMKERYTNPFSVIAPSKGWIRENCLITKDAEKWIDKLPGPYTLILKLENIECIAPNVNVDLDTLGVRMPDHWFSKVVKELAFPVVTTSANIEKQNFMISIEDLDPKIKSKIELMIYEGEKKGRPSKLIDLTGEERVIER
ncbi:threonylcarbamoyl-AMP synthase [Candidatus Woesearchaeota archaeon]|nr:threonylcarbamoyl-AMP synthase [Candidatus Woesearchaeota archaeon]